MIVMGASLAAYGLVWIVKFVVLDRYLFGADRWLAAVGTAGMSVNSPDRRTDALASDRTKR